MSRPGGIGNMGDGYWKHDLFRGRDGRGAMPDGFGARDGWSGWDSWGDRGDWSNQSGQGGSGGQGVWSDQGGQGVWSGQGGSGDNGQLNWEDADQSRGATSSVADSALPEEPVGAENVEGAYWRGSYRVQGPVDSPEAHRSGSVSARARQAYAAEALRQKDHVAAGLLAIFLGMFGVHKFYLGCNRTGFVMLALSIIGGILTLGLAAAVVEVIAIIEGVIYLTKSQTEFDRVYVLNQRDWF